MQVAPSGGKNWNQCKWRHLVAKFKTNASGANSWPDLQAKQVAPSRCQIYNQCTNTSEATFKLISVRKNYLCYRVKSLGPLCLWQCLLWSLAQPYSAVYCNIRHNALWPRHFGDAPRFSTKSQSSLTLSSKDSFMRRRVSKKYVRLLRTGHQLFWKKAPGGLGKLATAAQAPISIGKTIEMHELESNTSSNIFILHFSHSVLVIYQLSWKLYQPYI